MQETAEIQRVHRIGKGRNGGLRPILARFLRYKDCEEILAPGHRFYKAQNTKCSKTLHQDRQQAKSTT